MKRFHDKYDVDPVNGCHIWNASKTEKGYGRIRFKGSAQRAHRVAWELANGPIPKGMFVMHSCDNPSCVNTDHLSLGTPRDNTNDMLRKGRSAKGESHSQAKLTANDVSQIRSLRKAGVLIKEIASRFGVSESHISTIMSGRVWKEVPVTSII